jgi:NADH-quinone oxidoreductase subunit C
MEILQSIQARLEAAVPGVNLEIVQNPSLSGQHSLRVDPGHAREVARWLRDEPDLRFDYVSNVTGVDWLDKVLEEKVKVTRVVEGEEREYEEVRRTPRPGYLEAVYHLYSMALKSGPLVLRVRTGDRQEQVKLPSLTPVWRGCEFQEREVFDLFGIVFEGHPDLRRLLMWDEFQDHPMRKDYVEPDDFEYEPTAHDEVLQRAARYRKGGTPA